MNANINFKLILSEICLPLFVCIGHFGALNFVNKYFVISYNEYFSFKYSL